jgi:hypothetical protein
MTALQRQRVPAIRPSIVAMPSRMSPHARAHHQASPSRACHTPCPPDGVAGRRRVGAAACARRCAGAPGRRVAGRASAFRSAPRACSAPLPNASRDARWHSRVGAPGGRHGWRVAADERGSVRTLGCTGRRGGSAGRARAAAGSCVGAALCSVRGARAGRCAASGARLGRQRCSGAAEAFRGARSACHGAGARRSAGARGRAADVGAGGGG